MTFSSLRHGLLLGLTALSMVVGLAVPTQAGRADGTLVVAITGLRSDAGKVRLALYNQADQFPNRDGVIRSIAVSPDGDQAEALFTDLPEGRYAIAFFHDENGNGDFDQGLLGLPMEGYGFSRDAKVILGPPSFEDAALTVNSRAPKIIVARMRY